VGFYYCVFLGLFYFNRICAILFVLFTKYYWCDQIKEDEIGEACMAHGREKKSIQNLVGKREGERPLGRPRRRWEDTKIDLK
jgi:hypothetical protein